MRMFRTLYASEIECRISEAKKTQKGGYVKLLLYKTARTDATLLDENEYVGPFNWQCDYRDIDGKMYCGIGIRDPQTKEWIWKWNCGTESNTEAEKGEASDAFKRAGFVWGIGTELYSAPEITVWEPKCTVTESNGKARCYDKFVVTAIGYDENERINRLVINNAKTGAVAFEMGAPAPHLKDVPVTKPDEKKTASEKPTAAPTYVPQSEPITDIQIDTMRSKFSAVELRAICDKYRVEDIEELTKDQAAKMLKAKADRDRAAREGA